MTDCKARTTASGKKVLILGIDGMDPAIAGRLMKEGKLPNLSLLAREGGFSPLATTNPPQSIVAWTTFATGLNPGSHDIFDFIMRNPDTYQPFLGLNEITASAGKIQITVYRKGDTLWKLLTGYGVPSHFYFCPNTFPPDRLSGRMVSGMGVPDITGVAGRFTFYTTKPLTDADRESRGRVVPVKRDGDTIRTELCGPRFTRDGKPDERKVPVEVRVQGDGVEISFQGARVRLDKGCWSGWHRVSFPMGFLKSLSGIVRFYLKSASPEVEIYATPVNFDPLRPSFPISAPGDYAKALAKKTGLFYTQGMPGDTWALTEGRIDEKAFLEMSQEILSSRERILHEGLKDFRKGVFFSYFGVLDDIQHMFWRYTDPLHPMYEDSPEYRGTIDAWYVKLDAVVGSVMKSLDGAATLIVISDHGFTTYRRSVHLNRLLSDKGLLHLRSGVTESRSIDDVDWSKTKAYAVGFGEIYVNRVGREYYGIVKEGEYAAVREEIREGLLGLKDPDTGERVVKQVYFQEEIFKGPYAAANHAPDIVVGFQKGYRASWQTCLGIAPPALIEENRKKWSGDHMMDPSLVPGVLFANVKIAKEDPALIDIVPTVLHAFAIEKSENMPGENLFGDDGPEKTPPPAR